MQRDGGDSLLSIFLIFLRFGLLAWGGPVAQIAMIREELVQRRGWIAPEKFARVLAVYQALPSPEAHELCVYFGMVRGGRLGGFLAGLGFMLPGFILIILLAWAYMHFGAAVLLPFCAGFAPAVTALIVRALYKMSAQMLTHRSLGVAALVALGLTLIGVHFLVVFILCALWQALWAGGRKEIALVLLACGVIVAGGFALYADIAAPSIAAREGGLFLQGLQAGLLSFGGAYTAIPFLQAGMVGHYDAITTQSFLDGIALTGIIPAPLVIFGTFLGFLAGGLGGAVLMTLGIFIPAFSFTLIGHRWLEAIIENKTLHGALDGMSAAVIGLLAVTAFEIAQGALTGAPQIMIFIAALTGLWFLRGGWVVPLVIILSGVIGYVMI